MNRISIGQIVTEECKIVAIGTTVELLERMDNDVLNYSANKILKGTIPRENQLELYKTYFGNNGLEICDNGLIKKGYPLKISIKKKAPQTNKKCPVDGVGVFASYISANPKAFKHGQVTAYIYTGTFNPTRWKGCSWSISTNRGTGSGPAYNQQNPRPCRGDSGYNELASGTIDQSGNLIGLPDGNPLPNPMVVTYPGWVDAFVPADPPEIFPGGTYEGSTGVAWSEWFLGVICDI